MGGVRPEPPTYMYQHPGYQQQLHIGPPRRQNFVPLYYDQTGFSLPSGVCVNQFAIVIQHHEINK